MPLSKTDRSILEQAARIMDLDAQRHLDRSIELAEQCIPWLQHKAPIEREAEQEDAISREAAATAAGLRARLERDEKEVAHG